MRCRYGQHFPLGHFPWKIFVNRRSLLGIDNFTSALSFVLSAAGAKGETYVVADPGIALRLPDVLATLRQAQGRWPLIIRCRRVM